MPPRSKAFYRSMKNLLGREYKRKPRKTKQGPTESALKKAARTRARMEKTFAEISKPTWSEQSDAAGDADAGEEEKSTSVLEESPAQGAMRTLPPTSGFVLPAEVVNAAVHSLPYPRVNTASTSISSTMPSNHADDQRT